MEENKGRKKTSQEVPEMVQSQIVASNKVVTLETESAILGHGLGGGHEEQDEPAPSPITKTSVFRRSHQEMIVGGDGK